MDTWHSPRIGPKLLEDIEERKRLIEVKPDELILSVEASPEEYSLLRGSSRCHELESLCRWSIENDEDLILSANVLSALYFRRMSAD